jgi:LPPG:FO 2-phospho-L-lactate transferase
VIVALAGGTGGSKMVHGLALARGQRDLTAIVNTGDDGEFFGLLVCPDLDINLYALAGVVADRGWGYADDTFRCLEGLSTYGREAWFGLGDRDLATHIHRTLMMRDGAVLSEVVSDLRDRLGVEARVLPMSDDPVRTIITTPSGEHRFQEYLVRDGAREEIDSIRIEGLAEAVPAPGVLDAIADAELIVIAPSSPIVSIGTILGVPVAVNRSIAFKTGTVRLNGTTYTYYPSTSTASFFGGTEDGTRFLEGRFTLSASKPIEVPAR